MKRDTGEVLRKNTSFEMILPIGQHGSVPTENYVVAKEKTAIYGGFHCPSLSPEHASEQPVLEDDKWFEY